MKEVKIIGLKVNEKLGILQGFECKFDDNNRIVAIKGAVGAGKSTFQKSLQVGTLGSETLRHDKNLYGHIDQEVELLDGETPLFVGCKSDNEGKLKYTLYSRNPEGKKIENPVIDGVKATPSTYLKSMQTALTWRMSELTSENFTTQKNILLELYSDQLAKLGVIFDKTSPAYGESILGQLDKAIQARIEADVLRKQVGGFSTHLKEQGIDVDDPETLPKAVNIESSLSKEQELLWKVNNASKEAEKRKEDALREIQSKKNDLLQKLREYSGEVKAHNLSEKTKSENYNSELSVIKSKMQEIENNIDFLIQKDVYDASMKESILDILKSSANIKEEYQMNLKPELSWDGSKFIIEDFAEYPEEIRMNIEQFTRLVSDFDETRLKPFTVDTESIEQELEVLRRQIAQDREVNKTVASIESFFTWRDCNNKVLDIRKQYARLLAQVNTGVEGLKICFDEKDEKMQIYLAYNGIYSPEYFNNPDLEYRKLSSYSGTQKPMICLLIQNYLLSLKEKTMRYIWIDDVPIDNKTRSLIEKMASELNLTVMINITGDFDREHLESGEILIEGGEVFFD